MIKMLQVLKTFINERCPLKVLLPLSGILYWAPASTRTSKTLLNGWDQWQWLTGWLSILLGLMVLRIQDDLSDLTVDRHCHPERGLVSGRIDPMTLGRWVPLGAGSIICLNLFQFRILLVILIIIFYTYYYKVKKRLPVLWQILGVNTVFFCITIYAGGFTPAILWMTLFIGISVIAHDLTHSVHAPHQGCKEATTPSTQWGAQNTTLVGILAYAAAAGFGVAFWLTAEKPWLFGISLIGTTGYLALLAVHLVREPCAETAQPFYIAGFLFFVLPLIGFIIDRIFICLVNA